MNRRSGQIISEHAHTDMVGSLCLKAARGMPWPVFSAPLTLSFCNLPKSKGRVFEMEKHASQCPTITYRICSHACDSSAALPNSSGFEVEKHPSLTVSNNYRFRSELHT